MTIGTKVRLIIPPLAVYLIDTETEELATKEKNQLKAMYAVEDLIENTATIVSTEEDFKFKCMHCDDTHTHDCKIKFEHNNKTYYSSLKNLEEI